VFYIYFPTSLYALKIPQRSESTKAGECLPSRDVQLIFAWCILSQTAQMQEAFPYKKISEADPKEH